MPINRRCFWYTEDGESRTRKNGSQGCATKGCAFVHPWERGWSSADSSRPPPQHFLASEKEKSPSPREAPYSSASHHPTSSSHERRASTTRLSRLDSLDTQNLRHRDTSIRDRSPATSTTSTDLRERGRGEPGSSKRDIRGNGNSRTRSPATSTLPPPPVYKSESSNAPRREPTKDEKTEAWVHRIKLLADAVAARSEYLRLEREVQRFRQLIESRRLHDTSDENRALMAMQLTDSERQWEAKKQELNSIVYRMIDSEFWPVVPQTPDMVSPEERFRDLRTTVWELKGQAQELYEMMRTVKARGPSPVSAHPIKEHQDSEQPPAKRRRVSESTETKLPILPPAQPDSVISKELDALGDRFNALDVRLSDLENDMVQYDNEMFAELDERIEEKLAASSIPSSTGPEGDSAAPETIDTGQTMATRLQELEMDLAGAGKDIEEVAKEIGSIIKHAGEADAEIDKLRKENEAMRKQIAALDEQQKHNNEALKTYKAELDALNAAVSTYMTQSTTPPPQSLPDMGGILESIAPSMLAAVRQDIQPLLADVRSNVEDLLRKQSTELSTAVMAKLSLTLKTVEMISEWMEQMSQGGMPNGVQYANGGTLSGAARGNMLPPMKGDITVVSKSN